MYKLTNLALAMLMMLLMAACGNDDEMPTTSGDLEDTWTVVSFNVEVESTTEAQGQTVVSEVDILGENMAYDLTLDGTTFTTTGSYDVMLTSVVAGMTQVSTDNYSNVMGAGTYTNDATTMTINGSFFDLEWNGIDISAAGDEQTTNYTINSDDQLVISQNDTSIVDAGGVMTTSTVVSTSVWDRK